MSQLFDYLVVKNTYRKEPVNSPGLLADFVDSRLEITRDNSYHYYYLYDVKAVLGNRVMVSPEFISDPIAEDHITKMVYRPLAEAVFGEFREPLITAIYDIRMGNRESAIKKLDSVLDSMFKV